MGINIGHGHDIEMFLPCVFLVSSHKVFVHKYCETIWPLQHLKQNQQNKSQNIIQIFLNHLDKLQ